MPRKRGCPKGTIHLTATRVKVVKLYHKYRRFRRVAEELGTTTQSVHRFYWQVVTNRKQLREIASELLILKFDDDNVT
jgi:hypothetical protein